jgi:hypothetical protein
MINKSNEKSERREKNAKLIGIQLSVQKEILDSEWSDFQDKKVITHEDLVKRFIEKTVDLGSAENWKEFFQTLEKAA